VCVFVVYDDELQGSVIDRVRWSYYRERNAFFMDATLLATLLAAAVLSTCR